MTSTTDPAPDATEAAARAAYEHEWRDEHFLWDEMGGLDEHEERDHWRAIATAAVTAALPFLRRAFAEEAATAIEALPDNGCEVFHETVIRYDAVRIIRELGGLS